MIRECVELCNRCPSCEIFTLSLRRLVVVRLVRGRVKELTFGAVGCNAVTLVGAFLGPTQRRRFPRTARDVLGDLSDEGFDASQRGRRATSCQHTRRARNVQGSTRMRGCVAHTLEKMADLH